MVMVVNSTYVVVAAAAAPVAAAAAPAAAAVVSSFVALSFSPRVSESGRRWQCWGAIDRSSSFVLRGRTRREESREEEGRKKAIRLSEKKES